LHGILSAAVAPLCLRDVLQRSREVTLLVVGRDDDGQFHCHPGESIATRAAGPFRKPPMLKPMKISAGSQRQSISDVNPRKSVHDDLKRSEENGASRATPSP